LAAVPLSENLAILLYSLLALLFTSRTSQGGVRNAILAGAVFGLAILNRPQILGFAPLLVVIALVCFQGQLARRLRWIGLVAVCSMVVVAPWMIRNRIAIGGWFPVSLQGGAALYMGNNPYTQTPLTRLRAGATGWYDDSRWGAELVGSTPIEADRKAFHLAVDFIRTHPGRSLNYSIQKVVLFFSAYDHPVAMISWYPILALGLFGFWLTANRWRQLLPLYLLILQTALTAAVFTSMPRFRAPVEPFFLLMAAYVLQEVWVRRTSLRAQA
jgi:4-amino-4-deoxy-L-arabinose transferase-like glycosyltransferase